MALKVLVHAMNPNNNAQYYGVQDYSYSHTTGILSLTSAAVAPATGTTATTINCFAGITRVEIIPSVTNFPGNTAGTTSG